MDLKRAICAVRKNNSPLYDRIGAHSDGEVRVQGWFFNGLLGVTNPALA
jgi:hypothetical protein